jgi:hypothetical protein
MLSFGRRAAASMEGTAMSHSLKLGDVVAIGDGKIGPIVDIDPEDRNVLLVKCLHQVRVGRDHIEMVERAEIMENLPGQTHEAEVQQIRDHAQEIAVREAGQIARWQQVEAAADAIVAAARRYIREALPVPRSSGQNASDREATFCEVEALLLRASAAISSGKDITDAELVRVFKA